MKKNLVAMIGVLILFLGACGTSKVAPEDMSPLTVLGKPFSDLEIYYQIEPTEAINRRMAGFEISYSEEYGVLLLEPAESIKEIWAEMLEELVTSETILWTRITNHVSSKIGGPSDIRPIFVIANPFNPDLFWFSIENGWETTYTAFELLEEIPSGQLVNRDGVVVCNGRDLGLDYDPWEFYVADEPEIEYESCNWDSEWMMTEVPELEIGDAQYDELVDFLSGFLTVFNTEIGWKDLETGMVYVNRRLESGWEWDFQPVETLPLITLGGINNHGSLRFDGKTFIAQNGELITEAPFIYHNDFDIPGKAWGFRLHDLEQDGIPEIIIDTVHMSSSTFGWRGSSRLYQLIDGEFRHVHTFRTTPFFFTDNHDRLVVHYFDEYYSIYDFYYLDFTANGVATEQIIELPEVLDSESACAFIEVITETRTNLVRIPNWTSLEERMTELVREKLGITN